MIKQKLTHQNKTNQTEGEENTTGNFSKLLDRVVLVSVKNLHDGD